LREFSSTIEQLDVGFDGTVEIHNSSITGENLFQWDSHDQWGPDNQFQNESIIAFIRDGDIWLFDPMSGDQEVLTSGIEFEAIEWSPDGTTLIGVSSEETSSIYKPVYHVDIASKSYTHLGGLCSQIHFYEQEIWAPDGQKVVTCSREGSRHWVNAVNLQGDVLVQAEVFIISSWFWSEDSESIYYFTREPGFMRLHMNGRLEVIVSFEYFPYVVSSFYSPVLKTVLAWGYMSEGWGNLYYFSLDGEYGLIEDMGNPTGDWSLDGLKFIFQKDNTFWPPKTNPSPLYMLDYSQNINGVMTPMLVDGGLNPRWAPDGSSIAYSTWKGGLSLVDTSNGNLQLLLPNATDEQLKEVEEMGGAFWGYFATEDFEPIWSYDGRQLLFTHQQGFYLFDLDTGEPQWIEDATWPEWRPTKVSAPSVPEEPATQCGTWVWEMLSRIDKEDQRIGVDFISHGDLPECRISFELTNETAKQFAGLTTGGYTFELKAATGTSEYEWIGIVDPDDPAKAFLIPSLEVELHSLPLDPSSSALIELQGEYTLNSIKVDLGLFLLRSILSLSPPGPGCLISEEHLFFSVIRASIILNTSLELAMDGNFEQAKEEFLQIHEEFFEAVANGLEDAGVSCAADIIRSFWKTPGAIIKVGYLYTGWIGVYLYDYLFKYQGVPVRIMFQYQPPQ
jgi:Tol biopolymer transport system component